jgi:hypothetical protein
MGAVIPRYKRDALPQMLASAGNQREERLTPHCGRSCGSNPTCSYKPPRRYQHRTGVDYAEISHDHTFCPLCPTYILVLTTSNGYLAQSCQFNCSLQTSRKRISEEVHDKNLNRKPLVIYTLRTQQHILVEWVLLTSETPAIAPAANWYAKGRGFSVDDMVGCID